MNVAIDKGSEVTFRLCVEDWRTGKLERQAEPVTGFQIGRYAVAPCAPNVSTTGRGGEVYVGGCLVVHWQSGAVIGRTADFVDGCWFADCVSAFGPDVDGEDGLTAHTAIVAGMPQDLIAYLTAPEHRGARRPGFLAWRHERSASNLAEVASDASFASAEG